MRKKLFIQKDGAKVLLATAVAFALIFSFTTNSLKLRDQPPSWKITGERYGVDWRFRFGKSVKRVPVNNGSTGQPGAMQRDSIGPFFYQREMILTQDGSNRWRSEPRIARRKAKRDELFAELD